MMWLVISGQDWWKFDTRGEARAFAAELRATGYKDVKIIKPGVQDRA